MTEVEFESDAFLALLTDALRAGPGSPQWHEAVVRLRAGGIDHADEYRLLIRAREHLESGKEYRSVRAGPGFSNRLMAAIEEESAPAAGRTAPNTAIALLSAGVMLVVVVVIGYFLWVSGHPSAGSAGGTTLLTETVASVGPSGTLPADWKTIGRLEMALAKNSIKPSPTTNPADAGGGVTWRRELDPREPFAVVAAIKSQKPENELVAQVFVTDQPDFSEDNGTTGHELVWLLHGNNAQVILPGGRVETQWEVPINPRDTIVIRLSIEGDQAGVDIGGKRIWSGTSGLAPGEPKYVGVRYLRRGGSGADDVVFQWVRVNLRQK
jgi:hypothetical protein